MDIYTVDHQKQRATLFFFSKVVHYVIYQASLNKERWAAMPKCVVPVCSDVLFSQNPSHLLEMNLSPCANI